MTAPRPEQALLARLVDEATIESEPIDEIRADLAVFGIDPAGSVRLARRLAAGAASPAGQLLGRITEAESLDEELRRLEQADIAQVREQLPSGDSAAAVAHAHRASGRDSNVVGLRRGRSRRLTYALSGLAAALAASLVFYVGVSQNQHQQQQLARLETDAVAPTADKLALAPTEPTASIPGATLRKKESFDEPSQPATVAAAPAGAADAEAPGPASSPTLASDNVQARMEPAASAPEPLAERRAADVETSEAKSSEVASGAAAEAEATDGARSVERSAAVQLGDRKSGEATEIDQGLFLGGATEETQGDELRGDMSANAIMPPLGIDRPVVALLVVDPKLLPAGYRQDQFSMGNLANRLVEARRLAAGAPIAALVTLQYSDGNRDAVVLQQRTPEQPRQNQQTDIVADQTAAGATFDYEVRLLDRR